MFDMRRDVLNPLKEVVFGDPLVPKDYHAELSTLPVTAGYCDPARVPVDHLQAIDIATKKVNQARFLLKKQYAVAEVEFLDKAVLQPLGNAKNMVERSKIESFFEWLVTPAYAAAKPTVSENFHKARTALELSAQHARSHFGGSRAAGILGCAAHDLRWFDPAPFAHPIASAVGR